MSQAIKQNNLIKGEKINKWTIYLIFNNLVYLFKINTRFLLSRYDIKKKSDN